MKMRSVVAMIAAVTTVASLGACSSGVTDHPSPTGFPLPKPGTVVATVHLDGTGGVAGTALITRTSDDYRFSIAPSGPESARLTLALSPEPADRVCGAALVQLLDGVPASSPASAPIRISGLVTRGLTAPPADRWLLDPTLFRTLVVVRAGATGPSCAVSTATIAWRIRPFRSDLSPRDRGSRGGATGAPTLAEGRPRAYTLRWDDRLAAVADRFGLTLDELLYLNPLGIDPDHPEDVEAGTALNLDPARRGELPSD